MKSRIVVNIINLLLPFIQVFGVYVILFGHISPGGGFAGGSILGASMIIYRFLNGNEKTDEKFKKNYLLKIISSALILYGMIKGSVFVQAFFGGHSIIGTGVPGTLLSGGFILPLNILIGAVVAITFYFIATLFEEGDAGHGDVVD